jgi:hypothetical protein
MLTETNMLALEPADTSIVGATLVFTLPIGAAIGMTILCVVLNWVTAPTIIPALEHEPGDGAFAAATATVNLRPADCGEPMLALVGAPDGPVDSTR